MIPLPVVEPVLVAPVLVVAVPVPVVEPLLVTPVPVVVVPVPVDGSAFTAENVAHNRAVVAKKASMYDRVFIKIKDKI